MKLFNNLNSLFGNFVIPYLNFLCKILLNLYIKKMNVKWLIKVIYCQENCKHKLLQTIVSIIKTDIKYIAK